MASILEGVMAQIRNVLVWVLSGQGQAETGQPVQSPTLQLDHHFSVLQIQAVHPQADRKSRSSDPLRF